MGDFSPITIASQVSTVNLVAASCMTCLLYDHITTFDQEVNNMWSSRLSPAKVFYFTSRYIVEGILVFNAIASSKNYLSLEVCVFFMRWLALTTTICNSVTQGILLLRIWALHRNNKPALYTSLFFYLGGVITLVGLTIQDYVGEEVLINLDLNVLPGCFPASVPSIIGGFWIAPLIIESVLFMMVISRAYVWWREGTSAPRILSLLARDSTVYFAIMFVLILANYLVFKMGPPFLSSVLVFPCNTAGCILGCHMLLNLRALVTPVTTTVGASTNDATAVQVFPGKHSQQHREAWRRAQESKDEESRGAQSTYT